MENLTCSAHKQLRAITEKVIKEWIAFLKGAVDIRMVNMGADIHVNFGYGNPHDFIDRTSFCTVAEHFKDGVASYKWTIYLDPKQSWRVTKLERFLKIGKECAYETILHQFSRIFSFPHSKTNSFYVMRKNSTNTNYSLKPMFKLFIADTEALRNKRLNELTFSSTAKLTDEEKPWVHFCREWDGLAITPACHEWECCSCYTAEIKKQKEDAFFAKFFDVPRPQKMSDMYDDMSEEEMSRLVNMQEDHEAWALAQQRDGDDFSMLSLSAAELPDEEWNVTSE